MYIVTFYSFKGGVGRTMALVNVAAELAKAGRKVLIVDFDLEAPGLHTFDEFRPPYPHRGVVEYISDANSMEFTPNVMDYVYKANHTTGIRGSIWVMPAGRGDSYYRQQLCTIDWRELYQRDGYLLMEDLKAQWQETISPDYILIDSRTGHTDIEGICTRQLPDSVVIVFFPNEQNLAGLREVVRDIRAESLRSRTNKGEPLLHFVVSNVPDLDDEDEILKSKIYDFRVAFDRPKLVTIHNYPSLSLVNQSIFVLDRPKSRLAKEYVHLKDTIIEQNMEDREAAVRFLKKSTRPRAGMRKREIDERLNSIQSNFAADGEILYLTAMFRKSRGLGDESRALLDRAVNLGYRSGSVLLERAEERVNDANPQEIVHDVLEALQSNELDEFQVERAIRILRRVDQSRLAVIPDAPAVRSLDPDDLESIAHELMQSRDGLRAAERLFRQTLSSNASAHDDTAESDFVLCLIGLGKYSEALEVLEAGMRDEAGISVAFNFAMAKWGASRQVPVAEFKSVIGFHENDSSRFQSSNYSQCLSLSYWAVGDLSSAEKLLAEARDRVSESFGSGFSCWRYQYVSPADFRLDCDQIALLLAGESLLPAFMRENDLQMP